MKALNERKIGILGRGGAGKSTVTVLLAAMLRKLGHEVCVLDGDSTNVGLHRALGITDPPDPLIEHFGGMVFQGGAVTCPVDDPALIRESEIDLETLDPRFLRRNADGIAFLQAGKLATFGVGAGCDGPMVKIARDLRVRSGTTPSILIVDFKAGLEDSFRGALVAMDDVIVVIDPSAAGISAAVALKESLAAQRAGGEPATRHLESRTSVELARRLYRESSLTGIHVVANKVDDSAVERLMREHLRPHGIELTTVIPRCLEIHDAWLWGKPISSLAISKPVKKLVAHLEEGAVVENLV